MMHLVFQRKVLTDEKVEVKVQAMFDGKLMEVGALKFPTKQTWTKFIGAVQRGAMMVPEMEVSLENVAVTKTTGTGTVSTSASTVAQGGAK
jgi:hypothetical protein